MHFFFNISVNCVQILRANKISKKHTFKTCNSYLNAGLEKVNVNVIARSALNVEFENRSVKNAHFPKWQFETILLLFNTYLSNYRAVTLR